MNGNIFHYFTRVTEERSKEESKPWLTWIVLGIFLIIFVGLKIESDPYDLKTLSKWGYLSSIDIWNGGYWALITSVFVHIEEWHLMGNFLWMFILGGSIELEIGKLRWLIFFFFAALVSSGMQLAFSGNSGLGASGVIYAMFGFMWVTRNHYSKFKTVLNNSTIYLFVIWLIGSIVATFAGLANIGNAAHVSGLFFGVGIGMYCIFNNRRSIIITALALMMMASVVSLFWSPWSVAWVSKQAYDALSTRDYKAAIPLYRRSLEMGQDPGWVWQSLAVAYWELGDSRAYEEAINNLRKINEKQAIELDKTIRNSEQEK